jgi:type III secretory pathway component EscU
MQAFDKALRRVLKVSKDDMKRLLANDEAKAAVKQKRGRKPLRVTKETPQTVRTSTVT